MGGPVFVACKRDHEKAVSSRAVFNLNIQFRNGRPQRAR